jgi:hypothetical protein
VGRGSVAHDYHASEAGHRYQRHHDEHQKPHAHTETLAANPNRRVVERAKTTSRPHG